MVCWVMSAAGGLFLLAVALTGYAFSQVDPDEPLTLSASSMVWLIGGLVWTAAWFGLGVALWRLSRQPASHDPDSN